MGDAPLTPCGDCGMPCSPGEYHPFAACLMFKACHSSEVVRANLTSVQEEHPGAFVLLGSMREWYRIHGSLHFDSLLEEVDKVLADTPSPPVAAPPSTPAPDLLQRCQELLAWHKTGKLEGDALRQFAAGLSCPNYLQLRLAETQTADEAFAFVVASQPQPQPAQPLTGAAPLSDEQIEKLRQETFSTNNPFCPCDSKTMRKAVWAAERAHGIGHPTTPTPKD